MQLNSIFPVRYVPPEKAGTYEQIIIVNWLQMEVPQSKPMPILDKLTHWRNHEVYWFIKDGPDWTARCFQ